MREYGFSALTSVISERSASSSRMVRIAFIPAVPPPMIRCRRAIIQSFSALVEFRSFHRSARSSDDPRLAPRPDAPRLALPYPQQQALGALGREVGQPVRRGHVLVGDGRGRAGVGAGGIAAAEIALEGLARGRVVEHRSVRTGDRAELAAD